MLTLGIETSCDETSVALLRDGTPLANRTYTQVAHAAFGGVVPEIASRAHLQKVDRLLSTVLAEAQARPSDIDLLAVTDAPGLAGALLVGVSFALGLHRYLGTPLTGIHHLEGHICAILLEHPEVSFPFVALVVSGGHTALYRVDAVGAYTGLGQTVDDAAGEAFDKVGKLMGFPYPAGRAIDEEARAAAHGGGLRFPVARPATDALDFSFSGLKTAVKQHINSRRSPLSDGERAALCRAFEESVVAALVGNTILATEQTGLDTVVCAGGVAANEMLRDELRRHFGGRALFPSIGYCTDNAAMIARAGYERAIRGIIRPPCMSPSRELAQDACDGPLAVA
jgi:N6-L-threonylcarbamoyladenine synthase